MRRRLSETVASAATPTPTAQDVVGEDCSCENYLEEHNGAEGCNCVGMGEAVMRRRDIAGEGKDDTSPTPTPAVLQVTGEDPASTKVRAKRTTISSHKTTILPSWTVFPRDSPTPEVLPRADPISPDTTILTLPSASTTSPAPTYNPSTHTFVPTGYQTIIPLDPPTPESATTSSSNRSAQNALFTRLGLGLGIAFLVLVTTILAILLSRRHRRRRRHNDSPGANFPKAATSTTTPNVAEMAGTSQNTPNPWTHPYGIASRRNSSIASTTNIIITPAPGIASSPFFTSLAPAPAPAPAIPRRSTARLRASSQILPASAVSHQRASSQILPAAQLSSNPYASPPPSFPTPLSSNPYASPPPSSFPTPLSSNPYNSPPPSFAPAPAPARTAPTPRRAVSSYYPDDLDHVNSGLRTTQLGVGSVLSAYIRDSSSRVSHFHGGGPWDPEQDPVPPLPAENAHYNGGNGGMSSSEAVAGQRRFLSVDVQQAATAPHRYSVAGGDGVSPLSETSGGGIPVGGLPIRISAMSVAGPGERVGSQQWI